MVKSQVIAIHPFPSRTRFGYYPGGWIVCADCRVSVIHASGAGWHWYECVMCGSIDFCDDTWERRQA